MLVRLCSLQQRLEQLADDAEAELALELSATGREDDHPQVSRPRARLCEQPRLPDPRHALDHDRPARSSPCRLEQSTYTSEFMLAFEDHAFVQCGSVHEDPGVESDEVQGRSLGIAPWRNRWPAPDTVVMLIGFPPVGREPGRRRLLRWARRVLAGVYTENALAIIACSDPMVAPLAPVPSPER